MARHFIKGARTRKGERLFWSDNDGSPINRHNVYRKHRSIFGGSTKVDNKYDPSTGKFRE